MKSLAIKFRARIKKCHQRRIRSWIKRRHRIKKIMINRFLKEQLMHLLQMILIEKTLKNISSNFLMIWSTELSKSNSLSRSLSSKRNFSRCCMLKRNSFDEYISFRSWNSIRIKRSWFTTIIFRRFVFLFQKFSKSRQNFDTSTSHNAD
jgi:hypothetical protein